MKKLIHFLLVLFLASCQGCQPCEEFIDITGASNLHIEVIDSITGKNYYSRFDPVYSFDSLKVIGPDNNVKILFSTDSEFFTLSGIYNHTTDKQAFQEEICKQYILQYNYSDSDTIDVCFKAKKTKCGSEFDYLNVFRNDEQVFKGDYETYAYKITLKK